MKDSTTLVDDSVQALHQCGDALAEISQTCCLPERSPHMKEAQILIDNAVSSAKASRSDLQKAHKCIEDVGAIGSKIGFLYALCCTPTRELLYQSIFKELMAVSGNMESMIYRNDA